MAKGFITVQRYRIKVISSSPETAKKPARNFTRDTSANTLLTKGDVFLKIELKSPLQILALLMAMLTFSMPFVTFAQQNSLQAEAIVAAERDAQGDTNTGLWFLGGCLGGVIGVIVAYAVEPTPPATRLLGKSPEYVAFYTDAYTEKAKTLQANSALGGCIVNGLATAVFFIAAAAAEAAN